MPYQVDAASPVVTFDTIEMERQVAIFCQGQGIANNAAYLTVVNGLTAGSAGELLAVKALLKCVKLSP
jgi:hypothetical protein